MKKHYLLFAGIIICSIFCGCTSEINISLKKDGGIDVSFNGSSGIAFATLIRSASGVQEGDVAFDTEEISSELTKNGFSDVNVVSKNGTDLSISMKDKSKKSTLFSSEVLQVNEGKIGASLSAEKLLNFYKSSDEEIVTFLDMLLAPIFNDEVLTELEYIDTVASFYGNDAANEIKDSDFKITLTDVSGNTKTFMIPMVKLLTLNEVLELK